MERHHLLVFFTLGAVIEANHHAEIMEIGPLFDKNKVSDLERETFRQMAWRGGNAALCQIAHNSVQTIYDAVSIVGGVKYDAVSIFGVVKFVVVKIHWAGESGGFTGQRGRGAVFPGHGE
jgi:hypothetical protein